MTGLLNFLKKNKNTRKVFGKRELKIIEKQLNGVDLTQSEKNRLSRDIREKFRFIKEVSGFEDEFELKKGRIVEERISEAVEVIKEHSLFRKIKDIVIYGSIVEKRFHLFSDIDIAVKFDKINLKEATKFRMEVAGRLPEKIDVQVYNVLPEKIKKEIDKNGKSVYKKKDN